ncbi:MAG TPA: hypothetical protein VE996_09710 [Terriglobales bacterium]|nr:hypothetical protein [Terriglobales bacterium]
MATVPASSQELALHMDEHRRAVGEAMDKLRARLTRDLDVGRQAADHFGAAMAIAAGLGWIVGRLFGRLIR